MAFTRNRAPSGSPEPEAKLSSVTTDLLWANLNLSASSCSVGLEWRFSTRESAAPPQGTVSKVWRHHRFSQLGGATGIQRGKARDTAKHPMIQRTVDGPPAQNAAAQSVSHAKTGNPGTQTPPAPSELRPAGQDERTGARLWPALPGQHVNWGVG